MFCHFSILYMKRLSVLLTLNDLRIKFYSSAISTIKLVIHKMSAPSKPLIVSLFMIFTRYARIYSWHKSWAISETHVNIAYCLGCILAYECQVRTGPFERAPFYKNNNFQKLWRWNKFCAFELRSFQLIIQKSLKILHYIGKFLSATNSFPHTKKSCDWVNYL